MEFHLELSSAHESQGDAEILVNFFVTHIRDINTETLTINSIKNDEIKNNAI